MKVAIITNNSVSGVVDINNDVYQSWVNTNNPKLNVYKPIIDNIPTYNSRFEYVEIFSYTINTNSVTANYTIKRLGFDDINEAFKTIYKVEDSTTIIEKNNLITQIL
jgi:hypothetical protein